MNPRGSSTRPAPYAAAMLLAAAVAAGPGARADKTCSVHLWSDVPRPEWAEAIQAAQRLVDETAAGSRDCLRIDVEVTGDGAVLKFVTRDGRTAERALRGPADVRPVVEGLLVTVLPDAAPKAPPATAPASTTEPTSTSPQPEASDATAHLLVAPTVGLRTTSAPTLLGPTLSLAIDATAWGWALGAFGAWEPSSQDRSANALSGASTSAAGVGLRLGRREPVGAILLLYGVDAALLSTTSSADNVASVTTRDTRLGALIGIVWPRTASYRLRTQLQGDVAPKRDGHDLNAQHLSGLPRWGLSLAVGFETTLL